MISFTDTELTNIYNEANGLDPKRHNSITSERIFAAMRAMDTIGRRMTVEQDIANLVAAGKCEVGGSLSKMLRKLG
jgi:hypothetical protein